MNWKLWAKNLHSVHSHFSLIKFYKSTLKNGKIKGNWNDETLRLKRKNKLRILTPPPTKITAVGPLRPWTLSISLTLWDFIYSWRHLIRSEYSQLDGKQTTAVMLYIYISSHTRHIYLASRRVVVTYLKKTDISIIKLIHTLVPLRNIRLWRRGLHLNLIIKLKVGSPNWDIKNNNHEAIFFN